MPSTRSQPLNPRINAPPAAPKALPVAAPPDPQELAAQAARAGGFHESSYELKNGLEISESDWPADAALPELKPPEARARR